MMQGALQLIAETYGITERQALLCMWWVRTHKDEMLH